MKNINIERLKLKYLERVKLFVDLRDIIIYKIQTEIKSNPYTPIKYFITRIKSFERFHQKIIKNGILTIPIAFSSIHDILGIRLICLYKTNLQEMCDWVEANFEKIDRKTYLWDGIGDIKPTNKELQRTLATGYTSIHYVVKLKESQRRENVDLKDFTFEIQIRTILEEAWGEFTHEIYKDKNPPKFIIDSYQIISKYLNILNEQVEFLKSTYKNIPKEQIDKGLIEDIDLKDEKILFLNSSNLTIRNSKYTDCNFFTFKYIYSKLFNVEFNRCSLMNFDFTDAELNRVKFLNSTGLGRHLMNFQFKSSEINICEFKNSLMMNTDFGNVVCHNTLFEDIEFMNTDFFNAKFIRCTFKNIKFMNTYNVDNLQFVNCAFEQIESYGMNAEGLMRAIGKSSNI